MGLIFAIVDKPEVVDDDPDMGEIPEDSHGICHLMRVARQVESQVVLFQQTEPFPE